MASAPAPSKAAKTAPASGAPAGAHAEAAPGESRSRLAKLREIETRFQKRWRDEKLWEVDPPADGEQAKFFATFPYPYMNGPLHLGHAFTVTKAEFAVRFQRLMGRRAIFPFGLHVTGMPIAGAARKLERELAAAAAGPASGDDDDEPAPPPAPAPTPASASTTGAEPPAPAAAAAAGGHHKMGADGKVVKKRGKVALGSVVKILTENGVAAADVAKFVDPRQWLTEFPERALVDLTAMGVCYDRRRAFITTDANPYYDSFVRWQFEKLRALGVVVHGTRLTIYSPEDGQPCQDHDREVGEGVAPVEYTLVKLVVDPAVVATWPAFAPHAAALAGRRVVLPAATLRPETMFGQTNVWVAPAGEYGVFAFDDAEVWVTTARAMHNAAWQGMGPTPKCLTPPTPLFSVEGSRLIGLPVKAPKAPYEWVYVLPMASVSLEKGTGIVTSVPADSPDDWINFTTLKKKTKEWLAGLGVSPHMLEPFDIVPIIRTDAYGDAAAEKCCAEFKVQGPGDADKLTEAKKAAYLAGFADGVLILPGEPKWNGMKVKDAKPQIKAELIAAGDAVAYAEPDKPVVSRSGDTCVVAECAQWFIDYTHLPAHAEVVKYVAAGHSVSPGSPPPTGAGGLETNVPACRNALLEAAGWLGEWPVSRTFGLGTRLPWDEKALIDSLSDSTIYMAYYAVCHFLQGNIGGTVPGSAGIKAEQMTGAVWDYVYLTPTAGPPPAAALASGVPAATLEAMRAEFRYWYPMDLRVSGKDLIPNHLVMALHNHHFVWGAEGTAMLPRAYWCNGHILLDGQKMSKAKGNFITIEQAVREYGADATRMAMADSGDGIDDANFLRSSANAFVLRLSRELDFLAEAVATPDARARASAPPPVVAVGAVAQKVFEDVFASRVEGALEAAREEFGRGAFRAGLQRGLLAAMIARDTYRNAVGGVASMQPALLQAYARAVAFLTAPISPHFADAVWCDLLGNTTSIAHARWPEPSGAASAAAEFGATMVEDVLHAARREQEKRAKRKGAVPATKLVVYCVPNYAPWQVDVLAAIAAQREAGGGTVTPQGISAAVAALPVVVAGGKPVLSKAMAFAAYIRDELPSAGPALLSPKPLVPVIEFLQSMAPYISKELEVAEVLVFDAADPAAPTAGDQKLKAQPGKPSIGLLD